MRQFLALLRRWHKGLLWSSSWIKWARALLCNSKYLELVRALWAILFTSRLVPRPSGQMRAVFEHCRSVLVAAFCAIKLLNIEQHCLDNLPNIVGNVPHDCSTLGLCYKGRGLGISISALNYLRIGPPFGNSCSPALGAQFAW